jgi:hypothetical protein
VPDRGLPGREVLLRLDLQVAPIRGPAVREVRRVLRRQAPSLVVDDPDLDERSAAVDLVQVHPRRDRLREDGPVLGRQQHRLEIGEAAPQQLELELVEGTDPPLVVDLPDPLQPVRGFDACRLLVPLNLTARRALRGAAGEQARGDGVADRPLKLQDGHVRSARRRGCALRAGTVLLTVVSMRPHERTLAHATAPAPEPMGQPTGPKTPAGPIGPPWALAPASVRFRAGRSRERSPTFVALRRLRLATQARPGDGGRRRDEPEEPDRDPRPRRGRGDGRRAERCHRVRAAQRPPRGGRAPPDHRVSGVPSARPPHEPRARRQQERLAEQRACRRDPREQAGPIDQGPRSEREHEEVERSIRSCGDLRCSTRGATAGRPFQWIRSATAPWSSGARTVSRSCGDRITEPCETAHTSPASGRERAFGPPS